MYGMRTNQLIDELQPATLALALCFFLRATSVFGPLLSIEPFTFFNVSKIRCLPSFSLFVGFNQGRICRAVLCNLRLGGCNVDVVY